MHPQFLGIVLAIAAGGVQGQQCTQSMLPNVIQPIGGDIPSQADGIWYIYRRMGKPTGVNPRIEFNTVGPIIDPISSLPASLQWRRTALQPNSSSSACQNQFWTGIYLNDGQQIGDEGTSDDSYVMRPTYYTVLYHDYQNLMVFYSCLRSGTNGLCVTPGIFADTRKRPDRLSATELASFDATISSIFLKYCITLDNIPKNTFTDSAPFCPFVDPPPCIAQDIQGMKNTINAGTASTGQPTISSASGYSASPAPSTCKWPISIPSPTTIDPNVIAGKWFLYRRNFAPEQGQVNLMALFTNVGPSFSPLSNITARTYTIQYAAYLSLTSTDCSSGFIVFSQGSNGVFSGLITPYTTNGAIQPMRLTTLRADPTTIIYYGCEAANAQTGFCDKPTVVHTVRTNPLDMSEAEKTAADALEDSLFGKFGCGAKDTPLIPHTRDKPVCPFGDPPECVQKHITGYKEMLESTEAGPKY